MGFFDGLKKMFGGERRENAKEQPAKKTEMKSQNLEQTEEWNRDPEELKYVLSNPEDQPPISRSEARALLEEEEDARHYGRSLDEASWLSNEDLSDLKARFPKEYAAFEDRIASLKKQADVKEKINSL